MALAHGLGARAPHGRPPGAPSTEVHLKEQTTLTYQPLSLSITEHVATLTLNQPDDANALNARMAAELLDVAMLCSADANVHAVLVSATGKMFCAGDDL